MKGTLIVFEGTDGSGKATQARRLLARLTFPGTAIPSQSRRTSTSTALWAARRGT